MNRFEVQVPDGRLDLARCVSSGQVFRWEMLPDDRWMGVDGDQWYVVDESVSSRFEVVSNGSADDFIAFFRLDWDADEIERKIVERGPEMAPFMGTLRGLRLLRPSDPTESFFSFLCTPNNNISRIVPMVRRLSTYGEAMDEVEGKSIHRFPDVNTIAAISPAELRAHGFGYRGETIPAVACQVADLGGEAWIESLKHLPVEGVHETLCKIKGIGPKLADCISLFALHHTDVVPVDTHIWQALTRLYFPDLQEKPLTDMRYRLVSSAFRSRFGDLTGWAHQYLFYENVLNWRARK